MKKSNLIKVCSILLIIVMMTLVLGTTVNAATDNGNFTDMTDTLRNGNTNTNNSNSNTNTNNTNTNTNNTNRNTNKSNTNTNNTNTNTFNNMNTNNSSVYNNNDLPNTGIESSIPVALLIVIFAISSIYAYKKINDYKDI